VELDPWPVLRHGSARGSMWVCLDHVSRQRQAPPGRVITPVDLVVMAWLNLCSLD